MVIGRAALLRLALRVRLRQLIFGLPANRNQAIPLPTAVLVAIAVVALAAVGFPVIGGITAGIIAGGARVYLAADGARAAPGSAAVFVALAVAGVGLLLPSRAQQWRGLERLIAIQPVPSARVELIRRLDDSAFALSALLILTGPLLFEVSGQPATSSTAVQLSPGAVLPAVAGVVILAIAASVIASIVRTTRARPRTLNRTGQIALACSLLPLCYASFSYFFAALPRLTGLYSAVLSPFAWTRYLPVAGQVTDAAISWGHGDTLRAAVDWLIAATLIAAVSRLAPMNAPGTGEFAAGQPVVQPAGWISWAERLVPRRMDPRQRAVLLLCLRLMTRDRRVGRLARLGGPLAAVAAVSLWQALHPVAGHPAAGLPWQHDPAVIITDLAIVCGLLALADVQRRQEPGRWIIRTAPADPDRVTAATAMFAAAAAVPLTVLAGAMLAVIAPLPLARIVFVLAWAPLTAYLAVRVTAWAVNRPILAWVTRIVCLAGASGVSFGISRLATGAMAAAGGWVLPAVAAVAALAAVVITPTIRPSASGSRPALAQQDSH